MASTIRQMDGNTIHQICSNQVISDLVTAVKELVENAIDANATAITITLYDSGLTSIEVADNGSGIAPANFAHLTKQHYTSKITHFDDIYALSTMGFRGEALSSLCSVAEEFSVLTRTAIATNNNNKHNNNINGYLVLYSPDGSIRSQTPSPRGEVGTTVRVRNIFANYPVRRTSIKKNIKAEYTRIVYLLSSYILVHPTIRFSLIHHTTTSTAKREVVLNTVPLDMQQILPPVDILIALQKTNNTNGDDGDHDVSSNQNINKSNSNNDLNPHDSDQKQQQHSDSGNLMDDDVDPFDLLGGWSQSQRSQFTQQSQQQQYNIPQSSSSTNNSKNNVIIQGQSHDPSFYRSFDLNLVMLWNSRLFLHTITQLYHEYKTTLYPIQHWQYIFINYLNNNNTTANGIKKKNVGQVAFQPDANKLEYFSIFFDVSATIVDQDTNNNIIKNSTSNNNGTGSDNENDEDDNSSNNNNNRSYNINVVDAIPLSKLPLLPNTPPASPNQTNTTTLSSSSLYPNGILLPPDIQKQYHHKNPNEIFLITEHYNIDYSQIDYTKVLEISGYISSTAPKCGRSSADRQFLFLNKRPIDHPLLTKTITQVYKQYSNKGGVYNNTGSQPAFFINLKTQSHVDINLTPNKRTVLIAGEKYIILRLKQILTDYYELKEQCFAVNGIAGSNGNNSHMMMMMMAGGNNNNNTIATTNNNNNNNNNNGKLVQTKLPFASSKPVLDGTEHIDNEQKEHDANNNEQHQEQQHEEQQEEEEEDISTSKKKRKSQKQPKPESQPTKPRVLRTQPILFNSNDVQKQQIPQPQTILAPPSAILKLNYNSQNSSNTIISDNSDTRSTSNCSTGDMKPNGITSMMLSSFKSWGNTTLNYHITKQRAAQYQQQQQQQQSSQNSSRSNNNNFDIENNNHSGNVDTNYNEEEEQGEDNNLEQYITANTMKMSRTILKQDFPNMRIIGQFNRGFVLTRLTKVLPSTTSTALIHATNDSNNNSSPSSSSSSALLSLISIKKPSSVNNQNQNQQEEYTTTTLNNNTDDDTKQSSTITHNMTELYNTNPFEGVLNDDLFIIDQHASDEKYNYETLLQNMKIQQQPLIIPKPLHLSSRQQYLVLQYSLLFKLMGFNIKYLKEIQNKPKGKEKTTTTTTTNNNKHQNKRNIQSLHDDDDDDDLIFNNNNSTRSQAKPATILCDLDEISNGNEQSDEYHSDNDNDDGHGFSSSSINNHGTTRKPLQLVLASQPIYYKLLLDQFDIANLCEQLLLLPEDIIDQLLNEMIKMTTPKNIQNKLKTNNNNNNNSNSNNSSTGSTSSTINSSNNNNTTTTTTTPSFFHLYRDYGIKLTRLDMAAASRACRMSIMIGDALNTLQMRRLVNNLENLRSPWSCPHGRITISHVAEL